MKKTLLIAVMALSVLSCKNDDDSIQEKTVKPVEPIILSVEDGKQKLEDNSIEVLNKVKNFRNDTALKEIEEFFDFLTTEKAGNIVENTEETISENNAVLQVVKNTLFITTQIKNNNLSPVKAPSVLIKSITTPSKTELEIDFDELVGTHTWNAQKEDFDFVASNDNKIIYTAIQNNKTAIFTITNFTAYKHASGEEAPKSIKAELKVNGSTIMNVDYSATIADNEHIPTNVNASVSIGALSYNAKLTNNNTEGSISQSLAIGDFKILGLDINGQGDYADINTTGNSKKSINLLVNSANVAFSIGNIKIDLNGTSPKEVKDSYSTDEEVALLNDILDVTIKSGDTKIAEGEFYKKTELKDIYDYNEVPKFVVNDRNYNQIKLLDTAEELKNSEYYKNYTLYYNPRTLIESNVTINNNGNDNIWDYINNKYPNGTSDGKSVFSEFVKEIHNENGNYTLTYNLYTINYFEEIILEQNIQLKENESIWMYIDNNYENSQLEDGTSISFYKNYQYATTYIYNPNSPSTEEPKSSNYYSVEKLVDSPDMKLIFDDGSKATLEGYFNIGFDTMLDSADDVYNAFTE